MDNIKIEAKLQELLNEQILKIKVQQSNSGGGTTIRGKAPSVTRHYEPDPEKELAAFTILIDTLKKAKLDILQSKLA